MNRVLQKYHCWNNPAPGEEGHVHHDACRCEHPGVPDSIWRAYGDRYPGGYCRWLTDTPAGQRALERRHRKRREEMAEVLWYRVHKPELYAHVMQLKQFHGESVSA